MRSLFLQPHSDDAVLFGCWTLLRERPHVVTVMRCDLQEKRGHAVTAAAREAEDDEAFAILGVTHEQWGHLESASAWRDVEVQLRRREQLEAVAHVFAPAVEPEGHADHSFLGALTSQIFGPDRVTHYLTYTRADGRSTQGLEVEYEPRWVTLKHQALACYRSQIETPALGCTDHFVGDLREYVQA